LTDYIPDAASDAVDNGLDVNFGYTIDLLGTTRPQGAGWDIGCYEQ